MEDEDFEWDDAKAAQNLASQRGELRGRQALSADRDIGFIALTFLRQHRQHRLHERSLHSLIPTGMA